MDSRYGVVGKDALGFEASWVRVLRGFVSLVVRSLALNGLGVHGQLVVESPGFVSSVGYMATWVELAGCWA